MYVYMYVCMYYVCINCGIKSLHQNAPSPKPFSLFSAGCPYTFQAFMAFSLGKRRHSCSMVTAPPLDAINYCHVT